MFKKFIFGVLCAIFLCGIFSNAQALDTTPQTTKNTLYLHASSFQEVDGSNCDIDGYDGLINTGSGCDGWFTIALPVGTLLTNVSPVWQDGSSSCSIGLVGSYSTWSLSSMQTYYFMNYQQSSNYTTGPSNPNFMLNVSNTVGHPYAHEMRDKRFYTVQIAIDGSPYAYGSLCSLLGVAIKYETVN